MTWLPFVFRLCSGYIFSHSIQGEEAKQFYREHVDCLACSNRGQGDLEGQTGAVPVGMWMDEYTFTATALLKVTTCCQRKIVQQPTQMNLGIQSLTWIRW